jgi:hypothetical protein
MNRMRHALPLALFLSACGASQLAPKFAPPATPSAAAVAENISHADLRDERPVVVGLRSDNGALCAWDLTGALLFEQPVRAKSAPLVVGDSVVLQEADGISVRDLKSGKQRLLIEGEGTLISADGSGDHVVLSIAYKGEDGSARAEVVFVDGERVRWEKALSQPAGSLALVKNQVLVPWGTQRLSVLSADDGSELARWTFRNLLMGQARVDRGHVYVGQLGLLRVNKDLPDHQEGPVALFAPQRRTLPGQPPLLRDGYHGVAALGDATHKIKLEWLPGTGEQPAVEGNSVVLRFYRMAFGLAAQSDAVTWARVFEHDLVGSSAHVGGTFLVDDHGSLRFVDAQGALTMRLELGKALQVATIRAGNFTPKADAASLAAESLAGSLHDQLLAAAQLEDDRLFPARAFAIQHLARTTEPSVTRELIALCSRKGTNGQAAQLSACQELGKREGNAADILQGLRQKASFLEDTAAPPVGALAQAAARMQLKEAAPRILSHAEDPNTASSELVSLFQALGALEYQAAIPQLERFVRLHHAEPTGSDLAPALSTALSVLGKLRAKGARATLEQVSEDPLTLAPLQQKAKDALAVLDTPAEKRAPPKSEAPVAKAKQSPPAPVLETDPRPHALDQAAIQKTFRPLHAALAHCLEADPAQPKSMRITMIVAGEGRMEGFFVTPTSLQGCADAILRTARFPATRLTRQHVTHSVFRDAEPSEPEAAAAKPASESAAVAKKAK